MSSDTFGGVTCIIPVYNEGTRVLRVLKVLTQVKNLEEVMCVDDGSSDNTADIIKAHYPQVRVLKLEKNHGKSGAVLEGLKTVKTDYVMLIDGDLYNLQEKELEKAINTISSDPRVDMLVFRRKHDPWFSKLVRGDIMVTGERIMRTHDLLEIFKGHPNSYQIEVAINLYMIEHKKIVYWIPFSGTNVPKISKVGVGTGLMRELKMYNHIFAFGGNRAKVAKSFVTFCRQEYPGYPTI